MLYKFCWQPSSPGRKRNQLKAVCYHWKYLDFKRKKLTEGFSLQYVILESSLQISMKDFKVVCIQKLKQIGFHSWGIFTHTTALVGTESGSLLSSKISYTWWKKKIKPNTDFYYRLAIDLTGFKCVCVGAQCIRLFAASWTVAPPGSSVHGILQARILEWAAMPSSRGSSQPRDWTLVSCISCIGR